jgi:MFS family permease
MSLLKRCATWLNLLGFLLVVAPAIVPILRNHGLATLGAIASIALIVCSLFGELPSWVSWTQRLGARMYLGILGGVVFLLLLYAVPTSQHETSLLAFSPSVWAAYMSIVLVTLSFRFSSLPSRIYAYCQRLNARPYVLIPIFVVIAGLLGNVLDGVSIISIAVVIFLGLLERRWAIRASFALLFGGLISNLITVAAEPTNIKFDDVMRPTLAHIHPYYWFTNWPISILGILVPAATLGYFMLIRRVRWKANEPNPAALDKEEEKADDPREVVLSLTAVSLLGSGVVLHSVFNAANFGHYNWPLWLLILPAGLTALFDIIYLRKNGEAKEHIQTELPIWIKLMVIFSLLWLALTIYVRYPSIAAVFFLLPAAVQYGCLVVLSLLSSVTDNVALASMQGSIILTHPVAIWQMRLLFVLLTWAGGLTSFGCLQSLALNSHLKLPMRAWAREVPLWAATSITGGLAGLLLIRIIYPAAF